MKVHRPRSFFWSLTFSIIGILVLTAVLQFVFVVAFVEPVVRSRQTAQAEELIASLAPEIASALAARETERVPAILNRYQRLAGWMYLAFEPVDGDRVLPRAARRGMHGRGGLRGPGAPPPPDLADARILARRPVEVDGAKVGDVVVLRPRFELALTRALPARWFLVIPGALIATLLGGMWIFRRLQRRLEKLEAQARAVGEGDLAARIVDPGEDELGQVGHQLNAMTEKLEHARAQLDGMESERKRLLADITHEITTPLTAIRGYTETLLDERVALDAERRERYLHDVLHASERMGMLLDDLLDLSRLEAGAAELRFEVLDLDALVRHSVERHRPQFSAAGLEVRCTGESIPRPVRADGRRLEQVVDNLLNNAARHVPSGGHVEVEVRTSDQHVVLEVRDDGPGFGEEALEHVFERFYRAEASRTTTGSGLGLAIVREILLRHGGSIQAENSAEGGARLVARLPTAG